MNVPTILPAFDIISNIILNKGTTNKTIKIDNTNIVKIFNTIFLDI